MDDGPKQKRIFPESAAPASLNRLIKIDSPPELLSATIILLLLINAEFKLIFLTPAGRGCPRTLLISGGGLIVRGYPRD